MPEEARPPSRLRLAGIGLLIAVLGPVLLYSNAWDGARSVFRLLALCAGGAVVLVALAVAAARDEGPWSWVWPDIAVAVLVGWTAVATLLSPEPLVSASGARLYFDGLAATVGAGACYAAARVLMGHDPRRTPRALALAAGSAVIVLAATVVPALLGSPLGHSLLQEGRVAALVGQPTFLAGLMVLLLPLFATLAGPAVRAQRASAAARPQALVALAALPLCALLLLGAQSRAGWVAAALAVGAWWALSASGDSRTWRRALAVVGIVTLIAVLAVAARSKGGVAERIAAIPRAFAQDTGVTRTTAWKAAIGAAAERPLAGVGPGRFGRVYERAITPAAWRAEPDAQFLDAHDWYLNAAATSGLPAALAILALVAASATTAWRLRGTLGPGLAAACGFLGYAAHSLLTPNSIAVFPAAMAMLGVAVSARSPAPQRRAPRQPARVAVAALLVALSIALAVEGVRVTTAEYLFGAGRRGDLAAYAKAERLSPGYTDYAFAHALGLLGSEAGVPEAVSVIEAAAARSPEDASFAYGAGGLFFYAATSALLPGSASARTALDESLKLLSRAVGEMPGHPGARIAYASALAAAGRTAQAREQLAELTRQLGPDAPEVAAVRAALGEKAP